MNTGEPYGGRRLFLLRHALAMPVAGGDDAGRDLAPKGKEDAEALGRYMNLKHYIPDLVLCSPAKRTRQTLDGLQARLNIPQLCFPDVLYAGSTGDYVHEIQKCPDGARNILLVGHNPSIYELIALLAGKGRDSLIQRLSEGYKPASLSVLHCPCDAWQDIQPGECEITELVDPLDYNAPARPTRWM